VREKNSLASLRAKDEPGFHDVRKDKDGDCSRFTFGSCRILRNELLQGASGVADQIVGGRRVNDN
jgi:hypothetical protein